MTMAEEECWVARYCPGFGNPREMHADDFDEAMRYIPSIIERENHDPSDARASVEMEARRLNRGR